MEGGCLEQAALFDMLGYGTPGSRDIEFTHRVHIYVNIHVIPEGVDPWVDPVVHAEV